MADYKVILGIELNNSDLQNIKTQIDSLKGKPIEIQLNDKTILSQISNIKQQIQSLNNIKINLNANANGSGSVGGATNNVNKTVNELTTAYNKLKNISKNIGSIKIKLSSGLDTSKDVQQIRILEAQLQSLTSEYHKTVSKIKGKGNLSSTQWQSIQQQIDNTKIKLEQLEAEVSDARVQLTKKIQLKLESGTFANQINKIESDSRKLINTSKEVRDGITVVNQALNNIQSAAVKGDIEGLIKANEQYERALKAVKNQLDINARAEKSAAAAQKLDDNRNAFMSNIDAWLTKNSAAVKKFGSEMLKLRAQAQSCDQVRLNHLKNEFKALDKQAEAAGLKMQNFGDRIRTQFAKYSSYFSVASLFIYTTRALRDMFNQVFAIDSAMTELKKVTDETDASYNQFLSNAASRAKEIGTTIDGLVASTADFARLGYGFEDSQGLAEVANIYAVVGDEVEGVEGATQSLISTMAAFGDEINGLSNVDFATSIIDKFNEIGNKFAISSGGIGEALQRSASSLNAANNSIDESIALITAANTVVQNPDKVGNAFKTISMRIRGAKTELEEAGESTEGMVESTASLRQEILALSGIDIMLDRNTFKSTYQVMDELSAKWEELTDIQQASIIELMAGKHQGNVFASLMENFDLARDALEVSANSAGSAMREHEKWSQSLEAKLLKLKATWQSLSQSFMSSNFLAGVLNVATNFIDVIDKLIDKFGTLPTLLTGFTIFNSAFNNKGVFRALTTDLDGFINKVGIANRSFADLINAFNIGKSGSGLKGFIGGLTSVKNSLSSVLTKRDLSNIQAYNDLIDRGVGSQTAWYRTMQTSSSAAQDLVTAANGGKVAITGLTTSTIASKAALIGVKAAVIAFNAALTMGISAIISFIMQGLDKLIETTDELADRIDEVTSKYKEQHNKLAKLKGDFDTSNESSMISKYEKLSKGVDSLGRNISLTTDEYSEYQNIVNNIAEQIPSLVSGYDEQGNAILSCKGNVEELTEAYEKLIHAQNNEVLSKAGDIEKNFANTIKDSKKGSFLGIGDKVSTSSIELLEKILNGDYSGKEIEKLLKDNKNSTVDGIYESLKDAGIGDLGAIWSDKEVAETLSDALEKDPIKIKSVIDNYYAQFEDVIEKQKTIAQAKLSEAFDVSSAISGLNYGNISENLQDIAYQVVNSLDYDFLSNLSESGKSLESWVTEMLNQLNAISKADNAEIEAAFDLQTQFNGGKISYGEYVKNLKDVQTTIDGLNLKSEAKNQLEISLGLDDNGVIEQYNALVERLTDPKNYDFDITKNEAKKLLDGLSSEELAIAVNVITEMSNNNVDETIDQVRNAIDRELAIQGLTAELGIDVETTKLEALATVITESFSGSGLSSESLSAVEGMFSSLSSYDPSKLFERTANGIRLNSDELRRLNSEYKNTNIAKINKELDSLGNIYNQTREELYNLTYGTDEYNAKAAELSGIEERIKATEQLAIQYEGLASAYQEWQMAESSGSQRDMYESMIEGLENIDDEISRGWYDDGTIEFLELLTGRDLSTAGIDKVKEAYKGLKTTIEHTSYSVRDFFTVDDDGNSTNTGVYNFLDAIGQMEEEKFGGKDVVQRKDGKIIGFNFDLVGGDEVIAEALGVSEELVQIMVRAADDAGFVVSMDGTYQQLDTLKEKAQEAAESLNQTLKKSGKEGFDFNFNATEVDDIKKQLAEAQKILDTFRNTDGTINTKLEGADEALTVASTLQSMLDKLTRPTYMEIETSQVEDELQEPLKNLQELRRLIETEHQLKLSGADTSKLEESKQEVYEYFEDLDPEVKATLGLVDENDKPLTGQALKDKLNSGDIAIEATVDIQMKMDDKLGILVDKALLDAGVIDDKEFQKRVNIYLNADVDNTDAKNKTEQAVNEVTGSKGEKTSSKNNKSSDNKVEKNVDVKVKADEVDTSDVKNKTEKAVKDESTENLAVETTVELETTIDEALDLIEKLEDKDITIDVKVKGLNDVKELSQNIDLATKIDGNVDNLSEYVEGAKALSELDDNITSYVTANIEGNAIDIPEYMIDNLKVFAEGAKELKGIGSFASKVTADVEGNVIDIAEYAIDNLKVFSDSAANIDKIGIVESNVKANVDGNVIDTPEYMINNLKVYSDNAKDVESIGNVESKVVANVDGNVIDIVEYAIDNLKVYTDSAKGIEDIGNVESKVVANVDGNVIDIPEGFINNLKTFTNSAKDVESIGEDVKAKVTADVDGNVIDIVEYAIDNLKVFTDSAKDIKNIGEDTKAKITADVEGNVIDTPEYMINNLKVYTDSAKDIKNIGEDVKSKVTADIDGNVIDMPEYVIDNLKAYSDSAKNVESIGENVKSKVTADIEGNVIDIPEYMIDNLKTFYDSAKNIKGIGEDTKAKVTANIEGDVIDTPEYMIDNLKVFYDSAKNIKSIGENTVAKVTADVAGNVINTTEEKIDNLGVFADNANKLKNTGNFTSSVAANVSGNITTDDTVVSDLEHFASVVSGMTNQTVTVNVTANVDSANINTAIDLLTNVANSGVFKDYKATVQVGAKVATIDDTVVQNYKPPKKDGKVEYTVDSSKVDAWVAPPKDGVVNYSANVAELTDAQKYKTGTITYTANIVGGGVVNGTAFANGTVGRAFKQGDWGTKGSGVALGGELGQETIVRDGHFFTIGDNGAEFFQYKKGDIIFNHKQTEELFKNGKVISGGGRGRAFAEGTAFLNGSTGTGGSDKVSGIAASYKNSKEYKSSNSSSSGKEFKETFDWVEIAINRIQRAIDQLDTKANSAYRSWSERNKALASEISKVGEEISLRQTAYNRYIQQANSVGLSSAWAEKVRNGAIDINAITDEDLAEKIKDYQTWYEKALDCQDAILDLKETESELYKQRFDNVSAQYDGILGVIEHEKNMLEEYINQSETQAWLVSSKYYDALASNERETITELESQKAEMLAELQAAVNSGAIAKESEAWYEMVNSIDEVTLAITESKTALLEYSQTIQQLKWEQFDLLQEKISSITEETEFLIDLMSNDKLYDDNGQLTNEGSATMGLHGVAYNVYMAQAEQATAEAERLKKELAKDPYDTELEERYREMISLQQEHILAAEDEKEAIRDMVEEGIELELDALQERIDKYNEALDSQKDLYDYQRKVKEQTEEIASLEKQMAAYSGDDSEEARQKIQQIKVDLESAKADLEETEYDKYISDQQQLLDELYLEYETILNTRLDNIDALISDMIAEINSDAVIISDTIREAADSVGYTLSDSMKTIWNEDAVSTKNVITTYGDKFVNAQTTTNNALNAINTNLQNMITQLNKIASTNTKSTTTSSVAKSSNTKKTTPTKKTTTNKKSSGGDGTPKVGDRVKFISGRYYYDSYGMKPLGSQKQGEYVYITNINKKGSHPYHISTGSKLGKGDLGWLKLSQISGYATGKKNFLDDEIAWTQENGTEFIVRPSDGAILTPIARKGSVLNAQASSNIWDMANSPAEFIKDNLNLSAANIPNNSNVQSNYTQNLDKVVFNLPNVKNYDELLSAMQKDKNFERLILSMSIDRLAGKSSLAKGKSIR